ncbi:hypothetical protein ACHHYP_11595 [Achlya hypogyna]|uniref:Transmembrane protein n=1 Tax=Achlya hypogyna TaxID=1202772 RepID=A0A1V9YIX2_ACHHY|nr:hypothetical protein ACHHYP_11595 [Achlya hypogyna]
MCHATFSTNMSPTSASETFAFLGFNYTNGLTIDDLAAICALDMHALSTCASDYIGTLTHVITYGSAFASLAATATAVVADVTALNVSAVQYLTDTVTNVTELRTFPILDPMDRPWRFYGWCYLYEWASGLREVISVVGDMGRITTISASTPPMAMEPSAHAIPSSFSYMSRYCVQYITIVLILMSGLLALSAVFHKGHVEARNFLCVNRIVGMTWLGRPLVLVRSLSAIWLLNTSPLTLVQVGVGTRFTSPPLAWYTTLLATSEMTWFVYVLNDLFSCITQQYTSLYASKSSTLTWLVAFAWTLWSPQLYAASVDRHCSVQDMDFQLTCRSGMVAVGSLSRFGVSMAVICGCVGATYAYYRLALPTLPSRAFPCLVLSAKAYYVLPFDRWRLRGEVYIDKTTAIMGGLLSWELGGISFVLDIKTWRVYRVPWGRDTKLSESETRFDHALPLQHLGVVDC